MVAVLSDWLCLFHHLLCDPLQFINVHTSLRVYDYALVGGIC